ncbi:hypothetical protein, partial [Streptomyces sp. JW3]|uniref:hypothetical protein n=1 Tax=Streptomyces sp. JW3 TaxID=3456955 RepID=UPI003FA473DF
GVLRYLNEETAGVLAGLPTPQIGFNYLGRIDARTSEPGRDRDWLPVGEDVIGGGVGGDFPVLHALEVMGVVRDLAEGPELVLSVSWPGRLLGEESARAL